MSSPRVGDVIAWDGSLWVNQSLTFSSVQGLSDATSAAAATDNAEAINDAITAASDEGGGRVAIPQGTYYINSPIVVKSNVHLWIMGKLVLRDGSDCYMLSVAAGAERVTISGGELDGNKTNNDGGGGVGFADATARNVLIQGMWVHDCDQDGIRISGDDIKVIVCTTESNGTGGNENGAGISVVSANYFAIVSNYSRNNLTHGFIVQGVGTYGVIANNTAENNTVDNFSGYNAGNRYIVWTANIGRLGGNNGSHVGGDYITFSHNIIEDADDYGLIARNHDATTMTGFTCVGNIITNSGTASESGIWLGILSKYLVNGNTITGSYAHGILVQEGCLDGVISGNDCSGNGTGGSGDGIHVGGIGAVVQRLSITGNYLSGNTAGGMQVEAVSALIQGNSCKGNGIPCFIGGASASGIRVIGNDFKGNTSDDITSSVGVNAVDYWADNPNGGDFVKTAAATTTLPVYTDYIRMTGTTTVTSVTASWVGRRVTLRFGNDVCQVTDGNNLHLAGDFTSAPTGDTLSLISDGADWFETGRSIIG